MFYLYIYILDRKDINKLNQAYTFLLPLVRFRGLGASACGCEGLLFPNINNMKVKVVSTLYLHIRCSSLEAHST